MTPHRRDEQGCQDEGTKRSADASIMSRSVLGASRVVHELYVHRSGDTRSQCEMTASPAVDDRHKNSSSDPLHNLLLTNHS